MGKCLILAVLIALLQYGCAAPLITTEKIPEADVRACSELSMKLSLTERAALRGSTEAVRAGAVSWALERLAGSSVSVAPLVAFGYMGTGAMQGAMEAQDRRDQIIRSCLRDKGHKVY